MTSNHTPGSGGIAERILQAWLAANPEPVRYSDLEMVEFAAWLRRRERLNAMLAWEAYESAVIQFLVPEGASIQFHQHGDLRQPKCWAYFYPDPHDDAIMFRADTPAEALLSAIEAATQKDPS